MQSSAATAVTTNTNASGDDRVSDRADVLAARYAALDGAALLRPLIEREFAGRIAVVSSFGAESALVLHLVARNRSGHAGDLPGHGPAFPGNPGVPR